MVILALLAILFAIPTYGLSILALIIFAAAKGYLRGLAFKTKERYDNAFKDAQNSLKNGFFESPHGLVINLHRKFLTPLSTKLLQMKV